MKTASLKKAALAAAAWALIPSAPIFASQQELAISLSNPPDGVEASNDPAYESYLDENGAVHTGNATAVDVRLDAGTKGITLTANFADTCPAAWRNEDGVEYDAFWQVAEPGQKLQPLTTMYKNSKPFSRSELSDQSLRVDCDYDPNQPPPLSIRWSDVGNKDATATIDMAKCSPGKCMLVVLQIKWYKKSPDSVMGVEEKRRHYMPPPYPAAILLLRPYSVPEIECDPITTEGMDIGDIVNPAGACSGSLVPFQVRMTQNSPGALAELEWTVNDETCQFPNGRNTGETAMLQVGEAGFGGRSITLSCDFRTTKLTNGPVTICSHFFSQQQVLVKAVVVDGAIPGDLADVTQAINRHLDQVNKIYRQAAMTFVLNGPVELVTSQQVQARINPTLPPLADDAKDFSQEVDELHAGSLTHYNSNTGGVEVYFASTPSRRNAYAGICHPGSGIVIYLDAVSPTDIPRVIAHELGHACQLQDIYSGMDSNAITAAAVSYTSWPGGTPVQGYYSRKLRMPALRNRLLMNGRVGNETYDIPFGDVWGLDRNNKMGKIAVGLYPSAVDFCRNPRHTQ